MITTRMNLSLYYKYFASGPSCRFDQFTCNDNTCINTNQRCDGRRDCNAGEDEQNCRKS